MKQVQNKIILAHGINYEEKEEWCTGLSEAVMSEMNDNWCQNREKQPLGDGPEEEHLSERASGKPLGQE